jgi:BTB/POZ domain
MEELRDNKLSAIVEIAADGDVILVVGPEKVKLRVHSLFLKVASKPFSVMFGPDWKEGHNMLRPVEVPLPDDNAAALKLICAIIHHRNQKVPQTLAADDVFGIAVTADKYGCVGALKFASGNWLRPLQNEAHDLILLAAAAYLFRSAPAFKEITKALILKPQWSLPYSFVRRG